MSLPRFQSKTLAGSQSAPRLHVVTFGCQMNKYDSLSSRDKFRRRATSRPTEIDEADVILFNTCSVRDHAEERVFSWVGELARPRNAPGPRRRRDGLHGASASKKRSFTGALPRRPRRGTRSVPASARDGRGAEGAPRRARRVPRAGPRLLATTWPTTWSTARARTLHRRPARAPRGDARLRPQLHVLRRAEECAAACSRADRGARRRGALDVDAGAQVLTLLGQTVNSYGEDLAAPAEGERAWTRPPGPPEPRGPPTACRRSTASRASA
jgi:hypothetical protein